MLEEGIWGSFFCLWISLVNPNAFINPIVMRVSPSLTDMSLGTLEESGGGKEGDGCNDDDEEEDDDKFMIALDGSCEVCDDDTVALGCNIVECWLYDIALSADTQEGCLLSAGGVVVIPINEYTRQSTEDGNDGDVNDGDDEDDSAVIGIQ